MSSVVSGSDVVLVSVDQSETFRPEHVDPRVVLIPDPVLVQFLHPAGLRCSSEVLVSRTSGVEPQPAAQWFGTGRPSCQNLWRTKRLRPARSGELV